MPDLTPDAARGWIDRWERQQEVYLPDREERFTILLDALEAGAGRKDPVVLDLGCGPGSLSVRLLDRLPDATVQAIDADPVTLTLGRAAYQDRPGLHFNDLDLSTPGWSAGLPGPADAAVSTTALHWLTESQLHALYTELATVLRPGGLLLDGDHLRSSEATAPTLTRLERTLEEREDQRRYPGGHPEDWTAWWDAVAADPGLAAEVAERDRRRVESTHHAWSETVLLETHVGALRAAGFAEVGTLWQRGGNRLLCAVR